MIGGGGFGGDGGLKTSLREQGDAYTKFCFITLKHEELIVYTKS